MVIKTRRRAINHRTRTRKQIAGARLRELPEYISHEKYISDNLGMYFNDELLHKKKKQDVAMKDRAAAVAALLASGVKTAPSPMVNFKKRPEYISDAEYQAGFDEKHYYTENTYHQKRKSVVEPALPKPALPQPAISRTVKEIVDPLLEIHMNKRTQGKYIFDIINNNSMSKQDIYNAVKILLDNNFSPDYIIPESGLSGLCKSILNANNSEGEKIPLLLLDAHAQVFPKENLLVKSIVKKHEFVPQKLIETGYTPNTMELKLLGSMLRNNPHLLSPQHREFLIGYFRVYRIAATAALRLKKPLDKKRLTGDNAPETAFVIMGHGGELTSRENIVPEGCVLVTQVHSGEINYIGGTLIFVSIFNCQPEIKHRILDPVTNYEEISDRINMGRGTLHFDYTPLAIYRTGDIYREFNYTLLSYWDSDAPDKRDAEFVGAPNSYKICDSGLAQYPFLEGPIFSVVLPKTSTDYEPLIEAFRRSVYPTAAVIRAFIEAIPNPKTIGSIIPILLASTLIQINQTQLFERFGAGVYYNLVCRYTGTALLQLNESGKRVVADESRELLDSGHKIRHNRPEIFQAIREAEVERKNLVELLHLNDPNHFEISAVNGKISNIHHKIASGDINPRLPYLQYLYSKKYYTELLNYYKFLIEQNEQHNPGLARVYKAKIAILKHTVASPQHLNESDLQAVYHYPQRNIELKEISQQQKQKANHNSHVVSYPNNVNAQTPEDFEARAREAELEAQNKVLDWKINHLF